MLPAALCHIKRVILLLLLLFANGSILWAAPATEIQVGVLLDIKSETADRFVNNLQQEVGSLLGNQYSISLPEKKRFIADWSKSSVLDNYQRLLSDPKVDIIVAAGALNSAVLAQQKRFPKPLILLGILDYELQNIPLTTEKKSGVHNLTYVLESRRFGTDLDDFSAIFSFKNLLVIADQKLVEVVPAVDQLLLDYVKSKGSQARVITYTGDLDELLENLPTNADAVFFGGLYALSDGEKQQLIDRINQRKLPSYAFQGVVDVKRGALVGAALETNWRKVGRRIALNIEQILGGVDPAELATFFSFERRLTLNMETAQRIGFSPTWATLASVDQIAVGQSTGPLLDFKQTVNEALNANLNLAIEQLRVTVAKEDLAQARAPLLPALSATATATRVDENSAGAFQAEDTYGGALILDQLLYSEGVLAGLTAQKHLLTSAQQKFREVRYDIILNAGLNYLNILQAQSAERIKRNNLELVKKNLDVAEYRQRVGYAGVADVLRLKSEMATVTGELLAAQSSLSQAKIRLNEFLRQPIRREFSVQDVDLADDILQRYGGDEIRAAVDTPTALEKLTRFLVEEALALMPELQQVDESLAAQERILLSQERKRWLPIVNLRGKVDQVFDRAGVGSNLLPDDQTSWNLNLSANWQLISGGAISSEARQARVERDKLRQQQDSARRSIELALRSSLLDLRVKSAKLKLTETSVKAAKDSFLLVQDSYAQGAATITALLDAQNSALTAEQAAANSVYDYYASLLQVERAMGSFSITSSLVEQKDFLNRFNAYMANNNY